ncbi:MAG TPA: hypothetical protein VH370_09135, partial [Humisphaera sp.]|nr:hypothetical protein [Humisphaera sp.]
PNRQPAGAGPCFYVPDSWANGLFDARNWAWGKKENKLSVVSCQLSVGKENELQVASRQLPVGKQGYFALTDN